MFIIFFLPRLAGLPAGLHAHPERRSKSSTSIENAQAVTGSKRARRSGHGLKRDEILPLGSKDLRVRESFQKRDRNSAATARYRKRRLLTDHRKTIVITLVPEQGIPWLEVFFPSRGNPA